MSTYVEHLENQLELAQSRRTDRSPQKIRQLTTELKDLRAELVEWEDKYDERVQSAMEDHTARLRKVEADLRDSRFREQELECHVQAAKIRERELEDKLEIAQQNLEAVEAGSVHLEKRLDVMSGLLASSPTKLNFHIPPHARQRSMEARSPERISFGFPFAAPPASPDIFAETEQELPRRTGMLPPQHTPHRRMRRFGGSLGPKPLILPSTSYHEPAPLERNDSAMDYAERFAGEQNSSPDMYCAGNLAMEQNSSPNMDCSGSLGVEHAGSPISSPDETERWNRRRASTFSNEPPEDLPALSSPAADFSTPSRRSSRDLSLRTPIGRNLMEEMGSPREWESSPQSPLPPSPLDVKISGEELRYYGELWRRPLLSIQGCVFISICAFGVLRLREFWRRD